MSKSEVYSWRVSPERKRALEAAARRQGVSVARLLEEITGEWLEEQRAEEEVDEEEQKRIRARAAAAIGAISWDEPRGSERVSELVLESLREKYGR